jgi:ribonucleoside-diphosphate reductase alpha chain
MYFDEDTVQATDPLIGQTVEAFMQNVEAEKQDALASSQADTTFRNQEDAPACSNCGSITVRSGSCYSCPNCGSTSGCG